MGSTDKAIEIDVLERRLLSGSVSNEYSEVDEDTILYTASFDEMEDNYVKYQTAQWILYSLLLVLAWGIGVLMLLYLPVRRYVLRKDFRSRKLYVTPNAIVYKVSKKTSSGLLVPLCFIFYYVNFWLKDVLTSFGCKCVSPSAFFTEKIIVKVYFFSLHLSFSNY